VFVNDKLSQTYFKPFFRTRIIRILTSEIKYVLYVRSHYVPDYAHVMSASTVLATARHKYVTVQLPPTFPNANRFSKFFHYQQ